MGICEMHRYTRRVDRCMIGVSGTLVCEGLMTSRLWHCGRCGGAGGNALAVGRVCHAVRRRSDAEVSNVAVFTPFANVPVMGLKAPSSPTSDPNLYLMAVYASAKSTQAHSLKKLGVCIFRLRLWSKPLRKGEVFEVARERSSASAYMPSMYVIGIPQHLFVFFALVVFRHRPVVVQWSVHHMT